MQNHELIAKEDLEKFILAQPPERPIDYHTFGWLRGIDPCGCLLVEYALQRFPEATYIESGLQDITVYKDRERLGTLRSAVPFDTWGTKHTSFQTLQERIRESKRPANTEGQLDSGRTSS